MQAENLAHSCCGNVLVRAKGAKGLRYGEELVLSGNLYRPFGGNGAGRTNYRDYLYAQGIRAVMNIKPAGEIIKLNSQSRIKDQAMAYLLKANFERVIYKYLSGIPAAILDAMVLGEKKGIPQSINNAMIKIRTMHILVVSDLTWG